MHLHLMHIYEYIYSNKTNRAKSFASGFHKRTATMWNSLPVDQFCNKYNLGFFKARTNGHFFYKHALSSTTIHLLSFEIDFKCLTILLLLGVSPMEFGYHCRHLGPEITTKGIMSVFFTMTK